MRTARMPNPVMIIPEAMAALQALGQAVELAGVPAKTLQLVHLRASQINGCSVCLDMHQRQLNHLGETAERSATVAAWRDAPFFTDAERAALALTEAVTRLADAPDPVPDDIWADAARHYDQRGLAGLLLAIASINIWNRLNVPTRQVAGEWAKSAAGKAALEEGAPRTANR